MGQNHLFGGAGLVFPKSLHVRGMGQIVREGTFPAPLPNKWAPKRLETQLLGTLLEYGGQAGWAEAPIGHETLATPFGLR